MAGSSSYFLVDSWYPFLCSLASLLQESIGEGLYSTKTDVFAFGILVWEICTYAELPHKEMDTNAVALARRFVVPV